MHMLKFVAVFETLKAFFSRGFRSSQTVPGTRRSRHTALIKILTFEPSFLRLSATIILGSDWPTLIQINIQI